MTDARWTDAVHGEPSDVVRAVGLGVDYGRRAALRDVTLRLPAGELFGVLGPNGAGKSTLFRVLATLLAPTRGDVRICGLRVTDQRREIRAAIAHMPDLAPMPSDLRAGEYLRFFAECHGLRGAARDARVTECLDSVDLRDRAEDICTRLSLGMRQRLAVAKAMLHRPRLLILDEPASGLDAVARVALRAALRRQVDEGATVILSSHVPSEIQELCTSVGLLRAGRLLDAGPLASVLSRQAGGDGGKRGARFVATAPGAAARVAGWLRGHPHVQLVADAPAGDEIAFSLDTSGTTAAQLFTALGAAGLGVSGLRAVPPSVEDMVIHLSQTTAAHE